MNKNIGIYIVFIIVIFIGISYFININKVSNTTSISFYPTCSISEEDTPYSINGVKEWTTSPRTISINCQDKDNNCLQKEYTATFKEDGLINYITISDTDGNKKKCAVTTYIDNTKPEIIVRLFKLDEEGTKSGRPIGEFSSNEKAIIETKDIKNNINGYLNNEYYPYGVYIEVEIKDNLSLKNNIYEEKENEKFVIKDKKNYQDKQTTKEKLITDDTLHYILEQEGEETSKITLVDGANHKSEITINLLLDRTPPTIPIVKIFKWKYNNTKPTNSTSLEEYTSNEWTSEKIYTEPINSKDEISDNITYLFNSSGTTTLFKGFSDKSRNVTSQGISKISYQACDEAKNCSKPSPEQIIKIDRTGPYFEPIITSSKSKYNTKTINYSFTAKDALSGVEKYCIGIDKECTPNISTLDNKNIEVKDYDLKVNDYDGSIKKIYLCVADKVNNVICHNTEYKVYKKCSTTAIKEKCLTYSTCNCKTNKSFADKEITTIDKYLNITCDTSTKINDCSKKCRC